MTVDDATVGSRSITALIPKTTDFGLLRRRLLGVGSSDGNRCLGEPVMMPQPLWTLARKVALRVLRSCSRCGANL